MYTLQGSISQSCTITSVADINLWSIECKLFLLFRITTVCGSRFWVTVTIVYLACLNLAQTMPFALLRWAWTWLMLLRKYAFCWLVSIIWCNRENVNDIFLPVAFIIHSESVESRQLLIWQQWCSVYQDNQSWPDVLLIISWAHSQYAIIIIIIIIIIFIVSILSILYV
jgi:hypothetical protein